MIISDSKNFIFVHVWKTGGSSVRQALIRGCHQNQAISQSLVLWDRAKAKLTRKISEKTDLNLPLYLSEVHISLGEIKQKMAANKFNNYFKFGFVRNPWELRVSLYHYIQQSKKHPYHQLVKSLTFEDFINWEAKENQHLQSNLLLDSNDKLLADYVGRFEQLEQDFAHIAQDLHLKSELKHVNKSDHKKDYRTYYNKKTESLVRNFYQKDISIFGYTFK
jgi:hypothetical protein